MDRAELASAQKKAKRLRGWLVFIDETGVFLTPFVRRTWALKGQTPILKHSLKHHRNVSLIGALSISPIRRRLGWYLQFHANRSIRQTDVVAFVKHLGRHLRGPVIVIWDRLNAHRGKQVHAYLRKHPRFHVEFLPSYAPELNPNEYGWGYLKKNPLANYCPKDVPELQTAVKAATETIRTQQRLLRGFVKATGLPLRAPKRVGHYQRSDQ